MGNLNPKSLLEHLGIAYDDRPNRLRLCCPFHDDRNPSAGFYEDSEKFFCYTCSLSLDLVGFYAKHQGVSRSKAETELEKVFGDLPKLEIEDRKERINRIRSRTDRVLDGLKKLGLRECVKREEALELVVWQYERGKINFQKFCILVGRWIEENGEEPVKSVQQELE